MSENPKRYTVEVILKGLVLARATEGGLVLMMPDGRAPTRLFPPNPPEFPEHRPLREHAGVVEFYLDDWQNPADSIPSLLQVKKPRKEPVGIYLLDRQMIRLSAAHKGIELPEELQETDDHYNNNFADTVPALLKILDKDQHPNSFHRVVPFVDRSNGDVSLTDRAWEKCVGFSLIEVGEVLTERPSQRGEQRLQWEMRPLRDIGKPTARQGINLDLKVRFSLLEEDDLVVELWRLNLEHDPDPDQPYLPDTRQSPSRIEQFRLRPEEPGEKLELWIKNMELDEILVDTDRADDPFQRPCAHRVGREDRDHILFAELTDREDDVVIPVGEDDEFASCGAGCGVCTDP